MTEGRLLAVFHGKPRTLQDARGPWRTGYDRQPARGPLLLGPEGLPGDGSVHRTHGGPDRALLAFAASHYDAFRAEVPGHAFPWPSFGENLLVEGFDEDHVCIGDVFRIGDDVRVQVTMPRAPCANIPRFTGVRDLLSRVIESGRVGWLLRVLDVGAIAAGMPVVLAERPHPDWTIAHVYAADQGLRARDPVAIAESRTIATLPPLAAQWREGIEKRLVSLR